MRAFVFSMQDTDCIQKELETQRWAEMVTAAPKKNVRHPYEIENLDAEKN